MAIPSFIFGGNTGVSYQELQRRRAIEEARAKQARPFPKTIGEGIYSLGTDIGEAIADRNLTAREAQYARGAEAAAAPFSAATPPAATPAAAAGPITPPTTVGAAPQTRDQIAMALTNQGRPGEVAQENPTMGADTSVLDGLGNVPGRYQALVTQAEADYGLPKGLLPRLLKQESGFNPGAVSPAGAQGIAQLMPATARELGVTNSFDPRQAIPAAARYLRQGLDAHGNDPRLAAAYYHGGPDTAQWGPKTRAYADAVGGPLRGGGALALAAPGGASAAPIVLPRVPGGADEAPEPTPTDIQPSPLSARTQIAQAPVAGVPVVAPGEFIRPKPVPPKPPDPTPMSPRETAARQALQSQYIADPTFKYRAEKAIAEEEAKRKFIDDRNIEAYKADAQRFPQQEADYYKMLEERPRIKEKHAAEMAKAAAEQRDRAAKEQQRATFGDMPSFVMDDLKDRKAKAATAVGSLEGMNNAKLAMEAGTVFGITAPAQLVYYRARAAAGDQNAQRIVTATETFKNNLGPIAAAAIKAYGGPQISNEDRRFGLQMSGADITQDEASARRLLDIAERSAQAALKDHRQYLDDTMKDQPPALRRMFDVPDPLPGVPVSAAGPKTVVDVADEAEAQKLPPGTRFRLKNGRTGTVK
jgi:soluble lytic murein transglycosylase-like protein